ncbi:hypothetical protein OG229_02320 [Streptomyces platensis]|uniref:hypothetical protein n=1 Tax=Streptomyces platensis TaxID=58346 RepID=UPI002E125827|nr:hypothetical protein OG229_02320 [Streptomyces platensis]
MATHTVAKGDLGAHAITLVAGQVETTTFTEDLDEVTIVSLDGAAALYFTVDGRTPTVGGANARVVPAAIGAVNIDVPTAGNSVVKVISSGTPTISIQRGR